MKNKYWIFNRDKNLKDQIKFRSFIWLLLAAVIYIRVDLVFMDLDSINNMQWWRIQKWKNQNQADFQSVLIGHKFGILLETSTNWIVVSHIIQINTHKAVIAAELQRR